MPTNRKTKSKVGKPLILSLPEPVPDTPVNIAQALLNYSQRRLSSRKVLREPDRFVL